MKKEKTYLYEIDSNVMNILSIVILIVMILLTYIIVKGFNINFNLFDKVLLVPLLVIPYFVFHEILHSIGYVVNGADFKKITYGIHLEKGVLCCSCKQKISRKNILWSLIYPLMFIGIITYIIGLVFNIPALVALSISNISGCAGDIVMFLAFQKIKDFKFFEHDNPVGFGIITTEDLKNKKLFGLNLLEKEKIIQTTTHKISISKTSVIAIIIYYLIVLLPLLLELLFNL